MKNQKRSQNKLELVVAASFSVIILILSSTKIGYVPMSSHHIIDMGIIPAVFAAMIGGYRVGVPVAIIWGFCAYINPASNLQAYTLIGLMIERIILVVSVYFTYRACKKKYPYSPLNVYRAIIVSITMKNITANIIVFYIFIQSVYTFRVSTWMGYAVKEYLLELGLCSLAMMMLIKHLRQVHILNGVRRRKKQ